MANVMTKTTVKAIVNLLGNANLDTPFFSSDFGIAGGTINGLRRRGLVIPTGNTKEVFVCINEYDELYKKFEIKEWRLNDNFFNRAPKELMDEVAEYERKIYRNDVRNNVAQRKIDELTRAKRRRARENVAIAEKIEMIESITRGLVN